MAVKKTATTSTKKASVKKAAPKTTATKKAAPVASAKTAAPVAAAKTAKVAKPKAAVTAAAPAPAKKVATKKAATAAVKLTDRQLDILKAVLGTKAEGYLADKKAEAKTLDALANKKLIKKGAKDKTSGAVRYHASKAGEKHVGSLPTSA